MSSIVVNVKYKQVITKKTALKVYSLMFYVFFVCLLSRVHLFGIRYTTPFDVALV